MSASWAGVVTTSRWDCWLRLVLVTGVCAVWSTDCSAGLVGWAEVGVMSIMGSKTASTNSAELSILCVGIMSSLGASLVALVPLGSAASSVVVGWGWAILLLLLVMTSQPKLDDSADEEEEGSNDGYCEADLVELACETNAGGVRNIIASANTKAVPAKGMAVGISASKGGVNRVSSALLSSGARQDGDGDKSGCEEEVHNNGDECEEGLASETAREDDGEDGVYDTDTRHAFNSLLPLWNGDAAVGLDGEEVGVDS